MRVRLTFPQVGTNETLKVGDDLTVSELRNQIAALNSLPSQNVILSFRGTPLPDQGTLREAGFKDNDRITVQTIAEQESETKSDSATSTRSLPPEVLPQVPPQTTNRSTFVPKPPPPVASPTQNLPRQASSTPASRVLVTTPNGSVQNPLLEVNETAASLIAKLGFVNNDQQVFTLNSPIDKAIGREVLLRTLNLRPGDLLKITAGPIGGYFQ